MIDVINLHFDYPDRALLQGINFSLAPGFLLHLRGANGIGKTTLIKMLVGILLPSEGEIRYKGISIHNELSWYQQNICFVGHKSGISQILTVRENCTFELRRELPISFNEVIHRFGLQGFEDVPCGYLSLGQKRRVSLMRLLLSGAPLWLLDEPFIALDKMAVEILMVCIAEHLAENGQIILTSHQSFPLKEDKYLEYNL